MEPNFKNIQPTQGLNQSKKFKSRRGRSKRGASSIRLGTRGRAGQPRMNQPLFRKTSSPAYISSPQAQIPNHGRQGPFSAASQRIQLDYASGRVVFLANLNKLITERQLVNYFYENDLGAIECCRIHQRRIKAKKDHSSSLLHRGCGEIQFKQPHMAQNFINSGPVYIEGKKVIKRLSLDPEAKKLKDLSLNNSKRKMFVSGLSPSIPESVLREALRHHSGEEVEDITIIRHKAETLDRQLNTAFVTFMTEGTATRLNNTSLIVESTSGVSSRLKLEVSKTPKELKKLGISKTAAQNMSKKTDKNPRNHPLRYNINLPTPYFRNNFKPGNLAQCLYYPSSQHSVVWVGSLGSHQGFSIHEIKKETDWTENLESTVATLKGASKSPSIHLY